MRFPTSAVLGPLMALAMVGSLQAQMIPPPLMPARAVPPTEPAPQAASRKSPTLAALLSWLVFPGVGSYYAGNSGHGTRHLVIGIASLGGAIALVGTCDSDGFCDFDHDAARLSVAIGAGVVYVGNTIWSILTAVSDAERHNAGIALGRVSLYPSVTALPVRAAPRASPRVGLGVLRLAL